MQLNEVVTRQILSIFCRVSVTQGAKVVSIADGDTITFLNND